jgi:hypothetical protein
MATEGTDVPQRELPDVGRRIVLVTHRRSGTHLTIDLLRRQFAACDGRKRLGEPLHALYLNLDLLLQERRPLGEARALALLRRAARPIVKTHALPGFAAFRPHHAAFVDALLADADLYAVHRDGRDVMCSLHLYFQAFDPRARCPLSEFLRQTDEGLSRPRRWAEHVLRWRASEGVRSLAYEQVVADPRGVIERLAGELGLAPRWLEPLLPPRLRGAWQARWWRLASRRPPVTTVLSDPSGRRRPARWREAFGPEDRAFFHREAGDALVELGYERCDAWTREADAHSQLAGS